MSGLRPIRVVGVGSPNGDDAVGWEVLKVVRESSRGEELELHAVEGGQRLLELLDGRGSLILIDALAPAGHPGRVQRFVWPDARLESLQPGSTHDMRPVEALQLATLLGLLPQRVIVWGIEGESFAPLADPTPAVMAVLEEVAQEVIGEVLAISTGTLFRS
jgi:hydrogenase maturation protease